MNHAEVFIDKKQEQKETPLNLFAPSVHRPKLVLVVTKYVNWQQSLHRRKDAG